MSWSLLFPELEAEVLGRVTHVGTRQRCLHVCHAWRGFFYERWWPRPDPPLDPIDKDKDRRRRQWWEHLAVRKTYIEGKTDDHLEIYVIGHPPADDDTSDTVLEVIVLDATVPRWIVYAEPGTTRRSFSVVAGISSGVPFEMEVAWEAGPFNSTAIQGPMDGVNYHLRLYLGPYGQAKQTKGCDDLIIELEPKSDDADPRVIAWLAEDDHDVADPKAYTGIGLPTPLPAWPEIITRLFWVVGGEGDDLSRWLFPDPAHTEAMRPRIEKWRRFSREYHPEALEEALLVPPYCAALDDIGVALKQ